MSAAALRIYGIRNPVTVKDAEESEEDYIMLWQHGQDTMQFYKQLGEHHNQIKALTRHHLQLRKETITIAPSEEWIHGTFNLCVPIEVNYGYACRKFMFRCPMPHKNAEAQYEGTVEEKMGCELGAYVWIQEKCPNIRIPYLYGFGFGSGSYYTHEMQRPWYIRFPHVIRRHLHRLLRRPVLSRYIRHPIADIDFPLSYMLIEFISPSIGQMLSQTWDKHRNDPSRRSKLFQSISRIILSLARVPQLSIGSYRFNESGVITLTNRPLTSSIVALENEGAKRIIQSNQVYHSTEDFVTDTLKLHDNAFIQNPNGACDDKECRSLMAATTMLRTISHDYIEQKHRNGPYFLQFTDLTRSNVFVDDDWNITCLLDLEWISALPREMISVPHWLSGCDLIDGFTGKEFAKFSVVRLEFMHQFELEEDKMEMEHDISLTATINDIWNSQRVWFWYTMNTGSITLYPIVKTYIYSKFPEADIAKNEKCFSALWRPDAGDIMRKKRKDYNGYICHFTKLVEEHGEVPSLRS